MTASKEKLYSRQATARSTVFVLKLITSKSEIAFDDLEFKTSAIAVHWLKAMIKLNIKPVQHFWGQIPVDLVSDSVRTTAVMADAQMVKHIHPEDTRKYLSLFLSAYRKDVGVVKFLHPDYRTAETVFSMLRSGGFFSQAYRSNPWIAQVSPTELMDQAARIDLDLLACLPREQISRIALSRHLMIGSQGYSQLRVKGRIELAADFLKGGEWPIPNDELESVEPHPGNSETAFRRLLQAKDHGVQSLLMAYLINQPVEEVVALMKTRKHVKLAIEMFTTEELRPLLKTNRYLKEALLEESLGL